MTTPSVTRLYLPGAPAVARLIVDGRPAVVRIALAPTPVVVREIVAGPQGAKGDPGNGGSQRHNVTVPAGTWTITHTLQRVPAVAVYLPTGEMIAADVVATTTTVSVTCAVPTAGFVILT